MSRAQLPPEFRELVHGPTARFFAATLISSFGTGLILSLGIVYVRDVRHLPLWFAMTLLSVTALAGFALAPLSGTVTDRFGPVRPMIAGVIVTCAGIVVYAFAHTESQFIYAAILMTGGGSFMWGPSSVLLTRMVAIEHRANAYGLNFLLLNLGIGVGALVSALFVNLHDPYSFRNLYLANAGLSLCTVAVTVSLWKYGQPLAATERHPEHSEGGWREVLSDRRLLRFLAAAALLMICGYGSIEAGFSLFIVNVAHLSVHVIGVTFFFNTATIVVGQLYALRFIQGRSRTRVLTLVGVLWTVSWLLVASSLVLPHAVALVALCASTTVFAIGETYWQPVSAALINHLAPEHVRGRYNSALGSIWSISSVVAPLIGLGFIGTGEGSFWPLAIAGGSLIGAFMVLNLRHQLNAEEDGALEPAVA